SWLLVHLLPICGGRPAGSFPISRRTRIQVAPLLRFARHNTTARAEPARRCRRCQYNGGLSPAVIPRCCPSLVLRVVSSDTRYAGDAFVSRAGEASNSRLDRSSFASHAPPPR